MNSNYRENHSQTSAKRVKDKSEEEQESRSLIALRNAGEAESCSLHLPGSLEDRLGK